MSFVAVSLNGRLECLINEALLSELLIEEQKQCLSADRERSVISLRSLTALQNIMTDRQESILDCLKGSKLVFPTFLKAKEDQNQISTETIQRRKILKRKDEEREYNRMVYGVESTQGKDESLGVGKSMAAVQTQVSIMLNMVVATLTAYGIGYYFTAYFTASVGHRMAGGLGIAIVVMIIEMILYVLRSSQINC